MSFDTFNHFKDVLDTGKAQPNYEVSFSSVNISDTSPGDATLQDLFGCSGAKFDFTFTPPAWCHPNDGGDSGEKTPGAFSVDLAPLADGDQTFPSWPDSSTPSDLSFFPCDSTSPSSVTSQSQDPCSDINQNGLLLANCEANDVIMDTENDYSSEEPSTDLSGGDPRLFDPHTARRELTQLCSAPAGWTYRQILEVVALPPPEGLHLWHTKVAQLAADLGMPSGATGRDIVTFVLHVASVKNEVDKVIPLIKALAAAARVLEGRIVAPTTLLPVILALYPSTVPLCSTEPVRTNANTTRKRSHDEMESESEEEEEKDWEYDGDDDTDEDEPTFRRPRFTEEDLYCRVGDCLWAFDDPRICMKHRLRHFSVGWICPGPCKSETFSRAETLKRHLLHPKHATCMEAVLNVLGHDTIPGSGTTWLVPLRNGPERPWESPDFRLTDLRTVKEKMRLYSSRPAALPIVPTGRRRRYK